jgi:hypothetical protein
MRTTVILDADAERALRRESARTGKTHKEILNNSLRQMLMTPKKGRNQPFVQPTYHLAFTPVGHSYGIGRSGLTCMKRFTNVR